MKQFLIRYQFKVGTPEAWRGHIAAFIAALDSDPELEGRISYRCMKERDGSGYYHLAEVTDDEVVGILQGKDFFKRYNEETRRVGGGDVQVTPLELIGQTAKRA